MQGWSDPVADGYVRRRKCRHCQENFRTREVTIPDCGCVYGARGGYVSVCDAHRRDRVGRARGPYRRVA